MNNAFLVRVSISQWNARKLDKSATQDAKTRANAGDKANVKLYKTLLAAEELDAIGKIANAARNEHQQRTVPWAYDGPGAITAEGYPAYKAAMAGYEKAFFAAVDRFVAVYETERAALLSDGSHPMRVSLGKLFNPADYPMIGEIRAKFAFTIAVEPMPNAEAFNPRGLPQAVIEEIKQDIVENNAVAFDNANQTAWSRVLEAVEKLKLRMTEYTKGDVTKFYELWLDNVIELSKLVPSINISGDADLSRIGQKLNALTVYSNKDLKDDAKLRDALVKQATEILVAIGQCYQKAA